MCHVTYYSGLHGTKNRKVFQKCPFLRHTFKPWRFKLIPSWQIPYQEFYLTEFTCEKSYGLLSVLGKPSLLKRSSDPFLVLPWTSFCSDFTRGKPHACLCSTCNSFPDVEAIVWLRCYTCTIFILGWISIAVFVELDVVNALSLLQVLAVEILEFFFKHILKSKYN